MPAISGLNSRHVGAVGQRSVFVLTVEAVIPMEPRRFGGREVQSFLHKMRDADGNLLVWFASGQSLEIGKTYRIKGTIDEHSVYRGIAQTKLTRCKVAEEISADTRAPAPMQLAMEA